MPIKIAALSKNEPFILVILMAWAIDKPALTMTLLSTEFSPKPVLDYPFTKGWSPAAGTPFKVAEGVYWLRVPLPISLDHINLWILKDEDSWAIVDCGFDHAMCKDAWESVFNNFLDAKSVSRIFVTHFHPDHIGLASWLHFRCDAPVIITQGEFHHYRSIIERDPQSHREDVINYAVELGYDSEHSEQFAAIMATEDKPEAKRVQTSMVEFMAEGDEFYINGRTWRVVGGSGHSPEHACLHCPDLAVLIAGDQAIPRISSNVSVYPSNRHDDPLGDWIMSCIKLRDQIPQQTLVLPAHQEPFIGIAKRMQQLLDDHEAQLNRLRLAIDAPISALEARAVLFNRKLNAIETLLASGETLAHLNYLLHRKEIMVTHDRQGVARFEAAL